MVVVNEVTREIKGSKPLLCPKCTRGRIGSVPEWSRTSISARGKPPPCERKEYIVVRCPICSSYVPITIE